MSEYDITISVMSSYDVSLQLSLYRLTISDISDIRHYKPILVDVKGF